MKNQTRTSEAIALGVVGTSLGVSLLVWSLVVCYAVWKRRNATVHYIGRSKWVDVPTITRALLVGYSVGQTFYWARVLELRNVEEFSGAQSFVRRVNQSLLLIAFALFLKLWYNLYGGTSRTVKLCLAILVLLTIIDCTSHVFLLLLNQDSDTGLPGAIHIIWLTILLFIVNLGFAWYGYRVWCTVKDLSSEERTNNIRWKLFVAVLLAGACSTLRIAMLTLHFVDVYVREQESPVIENLIIWYTLSQFLPECGLFALILQMTSGPSSTNLETRREPLLTNSAIMHHSELSSYSDGSNISNASPRSPRYHTTDTGSHADWDDDHGVHYAYTPH